MVVPEKAININLPYNLAIQPLGINSHVWKAGTEKAMCMPMFMAAFFIRAKRQKQSKYPSTEEQINKMWQIHIVEYYLAVKRKDVLIYTITLVNLEGITLSKTSQTENDKIALF